jgi:hypothetical protein
MRVYKLLSFLVCLVSASPATCTEGVLSEQPLEAQPLELAIFSLSEANKRIKEFLADLTEQRVCITLGPSYAGPVKWAVQMSGWM